MLIAALLHLALFAVIGLRAPGLMARDADAPATMDIMIVPMPGVVKRQQARSAAAEARPRLVNARPVERPAVAAPAPVPAAPPTEPSAQVAAAPAGSGVGPGCEREVLLLLTPAERERCRNQIAADAERRARAGQAARDAETVREARAQPKVDLIPQEKRAYYDAVQASRAAMRAGDDFKKLGAIQAARAGTAASRNTSIDVNVALPRCSFKFGPNKEKPKPARGLLRFGPCSYQVQRGPLTEDAGTPDP